jgi:hypothetical protein
VCVCVLVCVGVCVCVCAYRFKFFLFLFLKNLKGDDLRKSIQNLNGDVEDGSRQAKPW